MGAPASMHSGHNTEARLEESQRVSQQLDMVDVELVDLIGAGNSLLLSGTLTAVRLGC